MIRLATALAATGVLAGAAASCRSIIGIEDRQEATPPSCGALHSGSATCGACVDQQCCDAEAKCSQSAVCRRDFECISACNGDALCASRCFPGWSPGWAPELADLLACRATSCKSSCPTDCGGELAAIALPHYVRLSGQACVDCLKGNACGELAECAGSAECINHEACSLGCSLLDYSCSSECQAKATPAAPTADAGTSVFGSVLTKCGNECGFGRHWECVKQYHPPAGGRWGADMTVTETFVDAVTGIGLPGVRVRSCAATSAATCAELDHTTTNALGKFTVHAATGLNGVFTGYFEVTGGDLDAGGVVDGGVFPTINPVYLSGDVPDFGFLGLVTTPEVELVGPGIGFTGQPDEAGLIVQVYDCLVQWAHDVRLVPSSGASHYIGATGLPDSNLHATSAAGQAVITGVPVGAGSVTVRGYLSGAAGGDAGDAGDTPVIQDDVQIRGGWLSARYVQPMWQ